MTFNIFCRACGAGLEYSISQSLSIYITPCECQTSELEAADTQVNELEDTLQQTLDQLADCRKHAPELFL